MLTRCHTEVYWEQKKAQMSQRSDKTVQCEATHTNTKQAPRQTKSIIDAIS